MSDAPNDIVIELKDVHKAFGAQKVLRGVHLQVREGTTLVIVGASGQGKSVILKHMLGLVKPEQGEVLVFGRDLTRIRAREVKEIRTHFGVLFQNAALFDSMTVFDNVALPLRERTKVGEERIRASVMEKLDLMDLLGAEDKYPAQISGGMRKRVGLARALMLNPRVVFFDEPTTGLDVHKSNEIYRLFHRTQQQLKYTAVIVSHDVPKIFKLADTVALLAEGVIQGCMSPEEFQLAENPLIREFVETTMGPIYSSDKEESILYETL
ncbi:ABC transporter ATP-binding protein [Geoalkalibacter sp.]|uniref:ABC transporter ATP-binding protein n=1 Tax=Geoalkalibacter sp. TaxID=3041440 RepID=UPI00272ED748|nr:ATP-binding cassette domain-containing protein [Geoalkalibacter sp.]